MTIEVPEEDRNREQQLEEVKAWVDSVFFTLPMVGLPSNPGPEHYQLALALRIREIHPCIRCSSIAKPTRATSAYIQHKLGQYPRWLDLCFDCSLWMSGQPPLSEERRRQIADWIGKPEYGVAQVIRAQSDRS